MAKKSKGAASEPLDADQAVADTGDFDLLSPRPTTAYNQDEQKFSVLLRERLDDLLRGRRNSLLILRKYHQDGNRLGIMKTPSDVVTENLRLPVVERMLRDTLIFLHDGTPGSAPSRVSDTQDGTIETQSFTTKWPHIIVVRTDHYTGSAGEPTETIWQAQRVQNQRAQIRINRLLDVANLGIEVARWAGIGR
jgi:hypothetical protein